MLYKNFRETLRDIIEGKTTPNRQDITEATDDNDRLIGKYHFDAEGAPPNSPLSHEGEMEGWTIRMGRGGKKIGYIEGNEEDFDVYTVVLYNDMSDSAPIREPQGRFVVGKSESINPKGGTFVSNQKILQVITKWITKYGQKYIN